MKHNLVMSNCRAPGISSIWALGSRSGARLATVMLLAVGAVLACSPSEDLTQVSLPTAADMAGAWVVTAAAVASTTSPGPGKTLTCDLSGPAAFINGTAVGPAPGKFRGGAGPVTSCTSQAGPETVAFTTPVSGAAYGADVRIQYFLKIQNFPNAFLCVYQGTMDSVQPTSGSGTVTCTGGRYTLTGPWTIN
jgi:hypothetical protein